METAYNGILFKNLMDKKWVKTINNFFESNLFIAFFAVLVIFCNLFGLELFVYPLVVSYGIYTCLFGRDMRTLGVATPFMYLSPSAKNNPAANANSMFRFENGLWMIIAYLSVFLVVLAIRIIVNWKRGLFAGAQCKLLTGFIFLAYAFIFGGLGQPEYTFAGFVYSVLLIITLGLLYVVLTLLVDWKTVRKDYFAWIGMFMGLIVVFELLNVYLQGGVIDTDGYIAVIKVFSGWGMNNNIAGVLICTIPCAFYLAATKESPFLYVFCATIIYIAAVFTSSRNGVLVGGFIFVVSALFALIPKKNRRKNIIIYLSILLVACTVGFAFWRVLRGVLNHLIEDGIVDVSRINLFKDGLRQFFAAPIAGKGFFACDTYLWNEASLLVIPPRWHCTVVQVLASCGIIGAIAYGFHRYQTVKILLEKPTLDKMFMALSISALLISSLFDCFLFNLGPCLFYSVTLAFLENSNATTTSKMLYERMRARSAK